MANFTDPHRQGWPVIRSHRHHALPPPESMPDIASDQPWLESSFDLQKGLDVSEDTKPAQPRDLPRSLS